MKDRALTPEQKREVLNRIYAAWVSAPHQRLGQLLSNSVHMHRDSDGTSLFYVEDRTLASWAEDFVAEGETVYGTDDATLRARQA